MRIIFLLLTIAALPCVIFGQLNYSGFSATNITEFSLRGDSALNGANLRLNTATASVPRTPAAAWQTQTHTVADGFVLMFSFRISGAGGLNGGGDGFTCVIQSSGNNAMGAGGGSLGYATDEDDPAQLGIVNSLAFEFDSYQNDTLGDTSNNHFSIHANPGAANSANESASISGQITSIPNLRDGAVHLVRIEFDGPSNGNQLRVYIDNMATAIFSQAVNVPSLINASDATVGFTGAVATAFENHDISNFSFAPFIASQTYQGTADDANAPGPLPVSSTDYHPGSDPTNDWVLAPRIDTSVLPSATTELWAKYYYPTGLSGGPYPVVVMLAGNHGTCGQLLDPPNLAPRNDNAIQYTTTGRCDAAPSTVVAPVHRGYDYLAERLASWGYVVVSINPNLGINNGQPYLSASHTNFPEYTDDLGLVLARGRLVLKQLQKLSEWNKGYRLLSQVNSLGTDRDNINGYLGMKITVGPDPVTVHRIGRMYIRGNTKNHNIRIVKASDNSVVATTSINMAGSWNHQQFKYVSITPVTLTANTSYYVVSEEKRNQDRWYDATSSITANEGITIDSAIQSSNGTTGWTSPGISASFGPVDLVYELGASSTPVPGVNFKGKLDFSNVGLMGHSRGGEGMRAAYEIYNEAGNPWKQRIFDSAALDSGIKGIFEIAPTDRSVRNTSMAVIRLLNAMKTSWGVILPACDNDVFNLAGAKPLDRMLKETAESPARFKSGIFVYGANHNAFNSQWHLSDSAGTPTLTYPSGEGCTGPDNTALYRSPVVNGDHVTFPTQMAVASTTFLAFMRANVGTSTQPTLNRIFDPRFDVPAGVKSVTRTERGYVLSSDVSQTKQFNNLVFTQTSNLCGVTSIPFSCSENDASKIEAYRSTIQTRTDRTELIHDEDFVGTNVRWHSASPARYFQVNWVGTSTSLIPYATLDFRVSRQRNPADRFTGSPLNTTPTTNFSVQLVMSGGRLSRPVEVSEFSELRGPVGSLDTPWRSNTEGRTRGQLNPVLQTVRIPLSEFEGADLTQVTNIRFVFNDTKTGSIFISNVLVSK